MRRRALPPARLLCYALCFSLLTSMVRFPAGASSPSVDGKGDVSTATAPKPTPRRLSRGPRREGELLVRFREEAPESERGALASSKGARRKGKLRGDSRVERLELRPGEDAAAVAEELMRHPAVELAEPNYLVTRDEVTPNAPRFAEQWALRNEGQAGGAVGADVRAAAWQETTGSRTTVVAVVDSGVDFSHPDLSNNRWANASELPGNGRDDDRNGLVDDAHGWDFVTDRGLVRDESGHGTSVAGLIAAKGNNAVGVSGVMWQASLMSLRVLDSNGAGDVASAVEAIDYAVRHGASVINCSWGTEAESLILRDAIERAGRRGAVVVASAGNLSRDLDSQPYYPAAFDLPNLISVASADGFDRLAEFSNRGAVRVTVAVPGAHLLTTQAVQNQEELRAKLEKQKEELARHQQAGEIVPHVNALMDVAETYEALNELENASDHYARTLPLLRPVTHDAFKAAVLLKLGQLSHRLERYQQAIDYFQQALPLSPKVQDTFFEATVHVQLGRTYKSLGNRQQAFEQFSRALSIYEKVKDVEKAAHAYALLGLTAQTRKEALDYYTRSLTGNQKAGSRTGEALSLEALATFYGDFDQRTALGYYEQALAVWVDLKWLTHQAPVFMQMGLLYDQLGEMSKARESFRKAIAIWQTLGDRAHEAEATIYLGLSTYEESDALRHFNHAAGLWRAENKPEWEASSLAFVSLIQAHLKLRREALDTLSQIALLKERAGARGPRNGHLDFYVGLTYRVLNDHQQTLKHLKLAVDAARAMEEHSWELRALVLSGRSCEAEGESQKALAYYLESIAVREKVIEGTRVDEIKILLAEQSADAYERAVLLAFKLGNHVQAFELSERARARALLDQLGNDRINLRRGVSTELIEQEQALRLEVAALQRQLGGGRVLPAAQQLGAETTRALAGRLAVRRQEYVHLLARLKASNPEYAALRTIDPINLKTLQALLNADTTLVSYFVTPKQSLAFVITRDSFRAVELCSGGRCVSGQDLKDAITQFRGFADLSDPHPPSLRKLYGWLVEPVKPHLRTATVCVIPHGVLHYLPFAALSSSGGSFLGEHYGIYYLPSASVLPFIRRKPAAADSLLAIAQSSVEGLPLLRHADETARKIAGRYNAQALTGSAATETAFRARAPGTWGLFLAAHGKMNPSSPLFSSIFLAPDEKNDGLLEVHEVYELDLREADNVVLSGCQTQLGELSRGDELVGLNRAFLYAGTPTVIASLWSVREVQTGEMMMSFYEGRSRGMSKAAALQKAQSLVRASHPHPYYWAAFVLTGAP